MLRFCDNCSCFRTFECKCNPSYFTKYIEEDGKQRTIRWFIIFILFLTEIALYSYTISTYNQPPQPCCGIIEHQDTACNRDDIYFYTFNPWSISIEHVKESYLCVIDSVRCDSFIYNNLFIYS